MEHPGDRLGPCGDSGWSLLEEAACYRALALGFLPAMPEEEPGVREAYALVPGPCGARLRDLLGRHPPEARREEEARVFGHTISKEFPPCETEYGIEGIFRKAQDLADIAGFYRAFGLVPDEKCGERLDHVSTELEFLAFMRLKEARAREKGNREGEEVTREGARRFLREHAARWMPGFLDRLSRRTGGKGFYGELAAAAKEFLLGQIAAAGVRVEELPHLEPGPPADAPEGSSFPCGPDGEPALGPWSGEGPGGAR